MSWSVALLVVCLFVPGPSVRCAVVAPLLGEVVDGTNCCLVLVEVDFLIDLTVWRGVLDHLDGNIFFPVGGVCCLCSVFRARRLQNSLA